MERECTCFLKDCCLKSATKNIFLLISNNLMIAATEMDLKGATQGNVKNSVSVSVNCFNIVESVPILFGNMIM